jgi:CBS domain-containing protein
VAQAVEVLQKHRIGAIPLTKDEKIIGILTERDFIQKLNPMKGINDTTITLDGMMTKNPQVLSIFQSVEEALFLMVKREFRHIPLMDESGKPATMISVKDVLEHFTKIFADELKKIGMTDAKKTYVTNAHSEFFGEQSNERGKLEITHEILYMPLSKLFSPSFITLDIAATMETAFEKMQMHKASCVVITQFETKVVGILTERDFLYKIYGHDVLGKNMSVREFMTPNPHSLLARQLIGHAINNMFAYKYRHIIIVDDDGIPVSVIGLLDILKYFAFHALPQ